MRAKIFTFGTALVALISVSAPPARASVVELVCELGKRVFVQGNPQTDNMIDLQWQGQIYRLLRVRTSTGANRFEDHGSGLVWISIPSKAMLLNSKLGEPVANECKAWGTGNSGRPVR
ncbi:MAG: hypothetical protein RL404_428 [Pseudomonadota bacterium]|jgi:hypothetical protein